MAPSEARTVPESNQCVPFFSPFIPRRHVEAILIAIPTRTAHDDKGQGTSQGIPDTPRRDGPALLRRMGQDSSRSIRKPPRPVQASNDGPHPPRASDFRGEEGPVPRVGRAQLADGLLVEHCRAIGRGGKDGCDKLGNVQGNFGNGRGCWVGLGDVTRDDGSVAFHEGGSSAGSSLPRRMSFYGSL